MTLREYFADHEDESPDCCTPYANKGRTHFMVVYDCGSQVTISTPTMLVNLYSGSAKYDEVLEQFAREVNPDYDLYSGWSDLYIATQAMDKIGCASCPWRDDCEMMGEELET